MSHSNEYLDTEISVGTTQPYSMYVPTQDCDEFGLDCSLNSWSVTKVTVVLHIVIAIGKVGSSEANHCNSYSISHLPTKVWL